MTDNNLKMFCITLEPSHFDFIKKLNYIPVGLGQKKFSNDWLTDRTGKNIFEKNRNYGEYTFHYWLWKNYINQVDSKWIGFGQYRKFWTIGNFENDNLNIDEATYLIKLLKSDTTADALAEIDDEKREKILKNLSAKEIAEELTELDTDDAVDIISELPEERKERVISQIEDDKHIEDIRELLTYDENTAGGLMAKELVKVNENLSVLKCLNEMRSQAENVTRVHSIYVVDGKNKLPYPL